MARGRRRGESSRIHQGLVGERALVGTTYLADPELRREYARDIAPRTRAALGKILAEVFAGDTAPPGRAIDLGAGTGAVGEALRGRFGADIDVVGVDRVAAPGIVSGDLARALPAVDGRFDLIVAAHLLGELFVDRPLEERIDERAHRVRAWTDALLAPGGTVILVEPALRETSRELLAVRDQLLALSDLEIVAPCFWTGACPALARERDWCHDAVEMTGAPRVDFSYLVLRDRWKPLPGQLNYRIVSDPLPEKGRLKLYACGPTGRHAFIRLDRNEAPPNAAFAKLVRGDIARIAGAIDANDGMRVEPTTAIAIRSPRPAKRGEG
ncbi:MAG TPA: small ribosomal subunit Rsm22 family protein [Polyangia bacterium]|nr:small ribosomal subunit Rsm22 family protein [Polyangia bacterium]